MCTSRVIKVKCLHSNKENDEPVFLMLNLKNTIIIITIKKKDISPSNVTDG